MPVLTIREIFDAARAAGFSEQQAVTWTAIALAESGGRTGEPNARGESDGGLWRIASPPGVDVRRWGDLDDPGNSARAAFEISRQGRDTGPWTANSGVAQGTQTDYRAQLGTGRAGGRGRTAGSRTRRTGVRLRRTTRSIGSRSAPERRPGPAGCAPHHRRHGRRLGQRRLVRRVRAVGGNRRRASGLGWRWSHRRLRGEYRNRSVVDGHRPGRFHRRPGGRSDGVIR